MKMQKIICQTAIAHCVATGVPIMAAERNIKENRGQLAARDYKFVMEAARGGMSEIRLGELASKKGQPECS